MTNNRLETGRILNKGEHCIGSVATGELRNSQFKKLLVEGLMEDHQCLPYGGKLSCGGTGNAWYANPNETCVCMVLGPVNYIWSLCTDNSSQ